MTGEDLIQHLTQTMEELVMSDNDSVDQHRQNLEAYNRWVKKDRLARIMVLSSMNDNLLSKYHKYSVTKELWGQLKFSLSGTSTIRLRSLLLKFEVYRKYPKHSMIEHLRTMSSMIRDLSATRNTLTDEQQIQAVIRSVLDSWVHMKQILTHNENIKNFSDISKHVELEVEHQEATRITSLMDKTSISGGEHRANGPKRIAKGK